MKFRIPDGGLAIWTEFNPDIDLSVLSQKAAREGLNVSDGKYIDQLVALTDHKNSAVRCYAFQALATKRSDKVFSVLLKHLNDTSRVSTQSGCIEMTEFTGDYFVDVVTPNHIEVDIYKLNQTEKKILDSILLNDKSIMISAKSSVLENLKPTADNYARIRQLAKDDRNESALRTLAKYQKQADKELIASFFSDSNTQFSKVSIIYDLMSIISNHDSNHVNATRARLTLNKI